MEFAILIDHLILTQKMEEALC